jgi:branched-chain amino acid transport system substrate-binding protein
MIENARIGRRRALMLGTLGASALLLPRARAADPIRVGCSMAMTGGVAGIGKQVLAALQIWKDDVNAKGGLLGREVALVFYDDQSNPSNVPQIYTKLMEVDKVDLLIGPYATNMVAPAIPVIAAHNMMTIGILANAANSKFHYPRYFSMLSSGPEPEKSFSTGFFDIALRHKDDLKTIAIVGADAEFAQNAIAGTRENLKTLPFSVVYDRAYPPDTQDFAPIVRAIAATKPDIVYGAAYPPDTIGLIRAANEVGLTPKLFGGAFIGLIITTVKMQLGPLINGIINTDAFLPAGPMMTPQLKSMLTRYQAIAAEQKIDPLGYGTPPFGYAAGQTLAQAVAETKSLDPDTLAKYLHSHTIHTVLGDIDFGKDGEWTKSGAFFEQFQHVKTGSLEEFRGLTHDIVVWPDSKKTGDVIYPYAAAKIP